MADLNRRSKSFQREAAAAGEIGRQGTCFRFTTGVVIFAKFPDGVGVGELGGVGDRAHVTGESTANRR